MTAVTAKLIILQLFGTKTLLFFINMKLNLLIIQFFVCLDYKLKLYVTTVTFIFS